MLYKLFYTLLFFFFLLPLNWIDCKYLSMSFNSLLSVLLNVCPIFYIWTYCFYLSHPLWLDTSASCVFTLLSIILFIHWTLGFMASSLIWEQFREKLTQFQKVPVDRLQDGLLCLPFSFLLSSLIVPPLPLTDLWQREVQGSPSSPLSLTYSSSQEPTEPKAEIFLTIPRCLHSLFV